MEEETFDIMDEYNELEKKYSLPSYERLAREFDIEKISEKDSSFLLREVRKTITEKTYSYMHLLENFLNPNPNPIFLFSLLKNLTPEIREEVKDVYQELSKLQMQAIRLDLIYSEEKESAFIKESDKVWDALKVRIDKILDSLEREETNTANSQSNDYFG